MQVKKAKFQDKDVVGFNAFDNGVVLKINQSSVLDAIDDYGVVALYLYLAEINFLVNEVYTNSPDESAPENLSTSYAEFVSRQEEDSSKLFCTNSAVLDQALILMDGKSVSECPIAKRNRAYVFISLETLHKAQNSLTKEIDRREQNKTFEKAFAAATGYRITVAKDSNKRVLQQVA